MKTHGAAADCVRRESQRSMERWVISFSAELRSPLAFYACRADPEPCLASPLPPRSDSGVEPQSEGTRSVGRQRGVSARGASADPPAAEAKFKSHNKIVCHREAINGDGFIADSPRVIGNLYSRCWKVKLIKTRGGKRRHSFGFESLISEQTFLVFPLRVCCLHHGARDGFVSLNFTT